MDKEYSLTVVKKSEEIIMARYSLPLSAQKLILLALTKMDYNNINAAIYVSKEEAQIMFGTVNTWDTLQKASNELWKAEIFIPGYDMDTYIRWVSRCDYIKGGGIKIAFTEFIRERLMELKGRKLDYDIKNVSKFTGKYGLRLYEMLNIDRKFSQTEYEEVEYSIDELRTMFRLEDKYPRYTDLRKFIIEPAIEDLKTSDLSYIDYEPISLGRKVTHILFKFKY